ncbi:MAG: hypothetical protein ACI8RZ_000384 [Myxococcota bacterium]|jgi:hypothetical protein
MKIRRRTLTGVPLLVASAGAMMTIIGCGKGTSEPFSVTSGNLVAPASVELCVTVDPDTAEVSINGQVMAADDRCTSTYEGSSTITAEAEGYADHSETVEAYADTEHHVAMVAE